jgi:S1-C subfamily serine protease
MVASSVRRGIGFVVAGAAGAGIAVGVFAATGGGGTTTVIQAAEEPPSVVPSDARLAADTNGALSVQDIYRRAGPGVVQITALAGGADALAPLQPGAEQRALGSGFVIDKSGHIVTNYHVVAGADNVTVNFSGRDDSVPASVVGMDPSSDIAVLDVDMPPGALTPLRLGDSDTVGVGDPVVAIGNPFGLDRTVTAGIVSAIQRQIISPNGFPIDHVIQTDAAINHGNSGGPLLNAVGEVIGVNSQIETGGYAEGNVGVGFAVPINTVKHVASQLIETGKVERAFLGIEMQTINEDVASELRLPTDSGVLISTVRPGSPAADAGLRGGESTAVVSGETWILGGDIVVRADGGTITSADELREVVLAKRPGDALTLEINRDGTTMTVNVKLGRQPTTPTG